MGSWKKYTNDLSCTSEELSAILTEPSRGYYVLPTDPYNEVYPGIYIGDGTTALCTGLLKKLGITHVLNAAQGKDRARCLVNTSPAFYRDTGIQFLGIEALDINGFHMDTFFEETTEFIQLAIDAGGKILVHCREGISRSATLVLAYLMIKRHLTAQDAVRTVREHREIIPNEGFLKQLCVLNEKLLKDRRLNGKSA